MCSVDCADRHLIKLYTHRASRDVRVCCGCSYFHLTVSSGASIHITQPKQCTALQATLRVRAADQLMFALLCRTSALMNDALCLSANRTPNTGSKEIRAHARKHARSAKYCACVLCTGRLNTHHKVDNNLAVCVCSVQTQLGGQRFCWLSATLWHKANNDTLMYHVARLSLYSVQLPAMLSHIAHLRAPP